MADNKWRKTMSSTSGDGFVMALEYAGLVAIFLVIGWLLDRAFDTTPWFVVIFAILGFIGGFLRLMYADRYDEARRAFRGLPPKSQREVPEVLADKERGEEGEKPLFDSKTGLVGFRDWNPRKYGEKVPDELSDEAEQDSEKDTGDDTGEPPSSESGEDEK